MNAADFRALTDAVIAARTASDDLQAQGFVDGFLNAYGQGAAREGQSAAYVCEYFLEDRDRPAAKTVGPWAPPPMMDLPEVSPAVAALIISKLEALDFLVEDLETRFPRRRVKASW